MGLADKIKLDNFTSRRSGTATCIINAIAPQNQKKETTLQIRLNEDEKLLFQELCDKLDKKVSVVLRAYINECLAGGCLSQNVTGSDLSVQNVRTNENGPIKTQSNTTAPSYRLGLHNKEEREEWLHKFNNWGVWLDVPEVSKKFYRFNFINGSAVVVEVGIEYYESYCGPYAGKPRERISFSIIDNEHEAFNSQGDSFTYVIQWLTKYAKDI